ncbi:MAG: HlyC/CorC family transporter [Deltaproteobacteria bacterium]|nr:HlyC/CorC family transporter [Deltaproteobacteria bacterium]
MYAQKDPPRLEEGSHQNLFHSIKSLIRKLKPRDEGAELTIELQDLMHEGQAKGLISDEESEMVQAVLELKETTASSIMIPRTEVVAAPLGLSLAEAIKLVCDCGHTRIPIYKNTIDEIIGILHAKDLLKLWDKNGDFKIPTEFLREPHFVSFNQKATDVLKELKEGKTHLAVVTDEYGGTAGIITTEDIIEEIVGEIMDEHDNEPPLLTVIDERTVSVDARLEVEKLEDHFDVILPEGDYESMGGFVIHLLGKIPKVNEKVIFQDLEMTVQSADSRRIGRILITRMPTQEPGLESPR